MDAPKDPVVADAAPRSLGVSRHWPQVRALNARPVMLALGILHRGTYQRWTPAASALIPGVVIVGLLMMLSLTYLAAHRLSDTVVPVLLRVGIAHLVWTPLAARFEGEGGSGQARLGRLF